PAPGTHSVVPFIHGGSAPTPEAPTPEAPPCLEPTHEPVRQEPVDDGAEQIHGRLTGPSRCWWVEARAAPAPHALRRSPGGTPAPARRRSSPAGPPRRRRAGAPAPWPSAAGCGA